MKKEPIKIKTNCSSVDEVKSRLQATQLFGLFTKKKEAFFGKEEDLFRIKIKDDKIKDEDFIACKNSEIYAGLPERIFKGNIVQEGEELYIIGKFVFPSSVYLWAFAILIISMSMHADIIVALWVVVCILILLLIGYLCSRGREKDLIVFLCALLTYEAGADAEAGEGNDSDTDGRK